MSCDVASLFSGIGGFDLGFERAGMRIVCQAEIDPFCRAVLARHWPDVQRFADVADVRHRPVDVVCGGFPCQDLSMAGRRYGLAGARSSLFFLFASVAAELVRERGWIVVENVPGLLHSAQGRDFAIMVRTLGDIGFHDLAWRVLDSRYFGVAQWRRRVYVVARRAAGDGARTVLLEPESGGGHLAPCETSTTRTAARAADSARSARAVSTLQGHGGRARGYRIDAEGAAGHQLIVESQAADADRVRATAGLPDLVDDPRPDANRYAAIGNAVTVNVAEWIGRRIIDWETSR